MNVIRTPGEMRTWSLAKRCAGQSVGLVPTMGALHNGHTSLIRECVARDDAPVVSIFVNPAQFAPHEDYDKYPRAFESDLKTCEEMGVQAVYAPGAETMYPENYATYVEVERLQEGLCGISRPHFFRGVATVVAKLFHAVIPDRAYFGQKDGQQTAIIKRLVRDLDFGIEIVVLPTQREPEGLAMSSRNAYLSSEDRAKAVGLSKALFKGEELMKAGERDARRIVDEVRKILNGLDIDYVELVDAEELTPVDRMDGDVMLAAAVRVGGTRLIDNIRYEVK